MSPILIPWTIFFETAAQTMATLTGLVIVAISVNIQKILAQKPLPARAFVTVAAMVVALVASLSALVPQPVMSFAIEMDLIAAVALALHFVTFRLYISGHIEAGRPRRERLFSLSLALAQVVPLTIGAVVLTFGEPRGLYGIAAALVIAIIAAVTDAWILLVEILRR